MNKIRNKSSPQAMRWDKMCIQDIPWKSTTIVPYWYKMLMFGEYQSLMIFYERPIKVVKETRSNFLMIIQRMILRFILTCFVGSDLKDGRKIEEELG
jgi:hypothetical protein